MEVTKSILDFWIFNQGLRKDIKRRTFLLRDPSPAFLQLNIS